MKKRSTARSRGRAGEPRRMPPATALTLFAEVDDGGRRVYRFRPGALNSYRWARAARGEEATPAPDADYLSGVRRRLEERRLRDCGYAGEPGEIGDGVLSAAVMAGIVGNPAFLDIVDDLLVRVPCLCCCYTANRARAEDAEKQIRTLLGYYSQDSYERSNAFYRVLCGLLRDTTAAEADMIANHTARGPQDHAAAELKGAEASARALVDALNRREGVCALYTRHDKPSTLYAATQGPGWTETGLLAAEGLAIGIYSTAEGRKFLRHLGKACKPAGLTLTTRLATSEGFEFFCLRHKLRLYVFEVHPSAGRDSADGGPAPDLESLWSCAAALTRRR